MEGFYKTKLLVEVEVMTQFGPDDAKKVVETSLISPAKPAITGLKFVSGTTNYNGPHKNPNNVFVLYNPNLPQIEQFPFMT